MENEQDIIDVEAITISENETSAVETKKAKKAKHQYGRQIDLFSKLTLLCARISFPGLIIFGLGSLALGIIYSEHKGETHFLVLMIIALSLAGISLLLFILRFVFLAIMKRLMKLDPNYVRE